jgi:large subunit ribosomal protein L4
MKTDVYNLKGDKVGNIELNDKIFARAWNPDLVHQVLLAQQANRRQPWAHAKTRGEVRGGGKKPWRQKGTGRARHGSTRSPIWVGGGTTHGPRNDRDYTVKVNKKMLRVAIHSVLSKKLADKELRVIDVFDFDKPKTKLMYQAVKAFLPALVVPATDNKMVHRVTRNIQRAKTINGASVNVVDLLKYKNILIEQKAVAEIK